MLKNTSLTTYISILRGINVSGKNIIKMEALRNLYTTMGFCDIHTYLQSGNVTFRALATDEQMLEQTIEQYIKKEFSLDIPVQVMNVEALKNVIHNNPFLKDETLDPSFFHVTFLKIPPAVVDLKAIESKKTEQEKMAFSGKVIYLYCPEGYGNTKLNNNFLEKRLKVTATTRNWKTTTALLQLAQETEIL